MKAFQALADPTRRRVLELLAETERPAGELSARVASEFGLSQPATSRHLRVLREADLVQARIEGARRIYALNGDGFREADAWLEQFRALWATALAALDTEVQRGKRVRTVNGSGDTR